MLEIKPNAYKAELYAYLLLKDNLLKDKNVIIGDNISNGLPDIHTTDYKIGIEVTCGEEPHIYRILGDLKGLVKKNNFDYVNQKFTKIKLKAFAPKKGKKYKYKINSNEVQR